jgi:hypothetical protein
MFRFFIAHLAGLPFPSRKRQTRQVKTVPNCIVNRNIFLTLAIFSRLDFKGQDISGDEGGISLL